MIIWRSVFRKKNKLKTGNYAGKDQFLSVIASNTTPKKNGALAKRNFDLSLPQGL
jgi:hypothetical protein